jgi:hypothetical protein
LSAVIGITKEVVDLSGALRKLKTYSAQLRLLRILHSKGSNKASKLLLETLEKSLNFLELAEAAEIALKIGARDKAKKLLIDATKKAMAESINTNLIYLNALEYIERLAVIDRNAAFDLLKDLEYFARKIVSKAGWPVWHLYHHPLAYIAEQLGDTKLAKKYLRRALKGALSQEFLTCEEVLDVIRILKRLGAGDRAKLFAKEYINEIVQDAQVSWRVHPLQVNQHRAKILEICVEADLGKSLLKGLLRSVKLKLKENQAFKNELWLAEHLAQLLNKAIPKRIYLSVAKKLESQRHFSEAEEYYQKADSLDRKTAERLAVKELKQFIPCLWGNTAIDYIGFWNTTAYYNIWDKPSNPSRVIKPDVAYSIGLAGDVSYVIQLSRKINDYKLKKRLLARAIRGLKAHKLYEHAARIAEEINSSEAKKLWTQASLKYEESAKSEPGKELGMLHAAIVYARLAGDSTKHFKLLVRFIESLKNNPEQDKNRDTVYFHEEAAKNVSKEFSERYGPLCMYVIEYLKEKERYIQLAKLLLRLGIRDRQVFEQALIQLEETGNYSEAARVSSELGDETLAKIYSFLQSAT